VHEEELGAVNEYQYIEVTLTSNRQFNKHFDQKLIASKIVINSTLRNMLGKRIICHSAKYKFFQATVRTIICYAPPVWEFEK